MQRADTLMPVPIGRRLPAAEFRDRPWRIHQMVPDFDLLDVWELPTPGGPGDLARLVEQFAAGEAEGGTPALVRLLWAVRWTLGRCLGWDDPRHELGNREPSLNARLPHDLIDVATGPEFGHLPFTSVFQLPDEFAAEMNNATCHGVLHLGWVPTDDGRHTAQLAVLAKPHGRLGTLYLSGIKPLRHAFVYPALLRKVGRTWRSRS